MTYEQMQLAGLKYLVNCCLTSPLVRQEIEKHVGSYRENGQPQEVVVECSGYSVVQEQPVHREEQPQDQPPIQANVPRCSPLLLPSRRDGLARKITALYQPLRANGVRHALEEGW